MIRYNSIDVYSFKRYRLELLSNQRPNGKVFTITEKASFAALIQIRELAGSGLLATCGRTGAPR